MRRELGHRGLEAFEGADTGREAEDAGDLFKDGLAGDPAIVDGGKELGSPVAYRAGHFQVLAGVGSLY